VSAGRRTRRGVLGVDVGTVSIRAVVHDEDDGSLLAEATEPLRVRGRGGAREVDFDDVWAALERVLNRLASALVLGRVSVPTVGLATTASTVATFDAELRPTAPGLLWADHRAAREAAEIAATGHRVLTRTLGHVSPEWGLPKLLHLWRREREAARKHPRRPTRHVLELLDWLDWKLTGRLVANAGIREWGWCCDDTGAWPADLVDAVGLREALDLVPRETLITGQPIGAVSPGIVAAHPFLGAATLTMGGMDSYAAALGEGVTQRDRLATSFGSSSSLVAPRDTGDALGWLYGPMQRILPGGRAYWHGGQSTAGLALDVVGRLLGRRWENVERLAASAPPGSDGLVFRETLLDRRTPWPRAGLRGVFDGLSLSHGPGHIARAALEGVAFGARLAAQPLDPSEVVIAGGLADSGLFRTILATALRRPVGTLRHRAAAAFGAAFAHDPVRIAALNPVVAWTEPAPQDPALEAAYARYVRLHRMPASVGEAPVSAADRAA